MAAIEQQLNGYHKHFKTICVKTRDGLKSIDLFESCCWLFPIHSFFMGSHHLKFIANFILINKSFKSRSNSITPCSN